MQRGMSLDLITHQKMQRLPGSTVDASRQRYFLFKRIIDRSFALLAMIVFSVPLLIIAVCIKLDSAGPVVYKQRRVGAKRKQVGNLERWELQTFTFYKFRSMNHDTDISIHRRYFQAFFENDKSKMAAIQGKATDTRKLIDDPRVTLVGRLLRKTSMDELPQFWNIFKGDMSLVGPRPPLPYEVSMYKPWHLQRLQATPGLTGLWQVAGRSSVDFDTMVQLDLEYIKKQTLLFDFKILLRTPRALISMKGAN
jgi:lipopolysaccharide/colanic/teichoic acid biosynthesis glycosyltransferase